MSIEKTLLTGVIVPVYRRPQTVLDALNSISKQTHPPHRLIIVDDGSGDETAQSVKQWIDNSRPSFDTKFIQINNSGAGAARNHGALHAKDCDLLAFLDSDDLWPADFLEHTVKAMMQNPMAVAASTDKCIQESNPKKQKTIDTSWVKHKPAEHMIQYGGPPGMSNSIFRASFFHQLNGFAQDIPSGEDMHLMLRISLLGPWLYVKGPVVIYRHNYAQTQGEEPALSHSIPNRRLGRAMNLQRFIFEDGGIDAIASRIWKKRLAALWFKAGKQQMRNKCPEKSRSCFKKAIQIKPWHVRPRLYHLFSRFL